MMNRQNHTPLPRPQTLEITTSRPKLGLILAFALLVFGVSAIVLGLRGSIAARQGWTEIMANAPQNEDCSAEFSFRYRLGKNATAEYRRAVEVYTEASARAFEVFHATRSFEGVGNLHSVNAAVNEPAEVEDELYAALELLDSCGDRSIYLAPVYSQLDAVFRSVSDDEAAAYDPALDAEARDYVERFIAFATDPDSVRIELLGDGRVCLRVSEDYLALAREYGVDCFVDFYWMRNAFAADLIADRLLEAGLTNGFLVSTDGFGRCLDSGDEIYALRVTDMRGEELTGSAEFCYRGPLALADLRSFPQTEGTEDYYYRYADGAVRTPYLSDGDGRERRAISELYLCSRELGCAELLMLAKPIFIAESFESAAADALSSRGAAALCFADGELYQNAAARALLTPAEEG